MCTTTTTTTTTTIIVTTVSMTVIVIIIIIIIIITIFYSVKATWYPTCVANPYYAVTTQICATSSCYQSQ